MLNKVQLIGNIGRDPEIRSTNAGTRVASFSLATSERWKDRSSGEQKERTEWHNIVVFSEGLVGIIEKYVKKGSKLYVEGKLQTRKWEKDGVDRYTTEVVLTGFDAKIELLGERSNGGGSRPPAAESAEDYGRPQTRGGGEVGRDDDLNDAIPFATNTLDRDIIFARNRKPRSVV